MGLKAAAWVAAALTAASAVDQRNTAQKQEKAAEKQAKVESAAEASTAARARRSAAAEALVGIRDIENTAAVTGTQGSAVIAGTQGIQGQLTKTSGDLTLQQTSNQAINEAKMDVFKAGQPNAGSIFLNAASGIATSATSSALGAKLAKTP